MMIRHCAARLCLIAPALLLAPLAAQATVWAESGAAIDTVVADTDSTVPPAALTPLNVPVPFKGFRYPHVDAAQNVTVIADDFVSAPGAAHHGIYRSSAADGSFKPLVSANDFFPGTDHQLTLLRGLQTDENGVDFVFNATSDHDRALFLWSKGVRTTIASMGQPALPGGTGPLTDVHWGAMSGGRILFTAWEKAGPLLAVHDLATGVDRVLLRHSDAIPGHPDELFASIANQNWIDSTSVVFRGGVSDGNVMTKANGGRCGVYGWFNIRWDDPSSFDLSKLVTIADTDTPPPGREDSRFSAFWSAPTLDGFTAFRADGSRGSGLYCSKNSGPLQLIVDTETEMAGLFKGPVTSIGIWTATVKDGVVFVARAEKGFTGVFLYRMKEDAIYLLADNRTPIDGKRVGSFEVGSHPLVGQRFAVTANFGVNAAGVYLATIPAKAFKRATATVAAR